MCLSGSGDRDVGGGFRGGQGRGRGWARGGGYYNGRGNVFMLMFLTTGIKTLYHCMLYSRIAEVNSVNC